MPGLYCLGLEVCPEEQYGQYEIHVTGDVAFGFYQYLAMSLDIDMLENGRMKEAVFAMADFWKYRATYNHTLGFYEYLGTDSFKCRLAKDNLSSVVLDRFFVKRQVILNLLMC